MKPLNPATMASYTVPSRPAQQFVKQRLKGGLAAKGWERRPGSDYSSYVEVWY